MRVRLVWQGKAHTSYCQVMPAQLELEMELELGQSAMQCSAVQCSAVLSPVQSSPVQAGLPVDPLCVCIFFLFGSAITVLPCCALGPTLSLAA